MGGDISDELCKATATLEAKTACATASLASLKAEDCADDAYETIFLCQTVCFDKHNLTDWKVVWKPLGIIVFLVLMFFRTLRCFQQVFAVCVFHRHRNPCRTVCK